ncbi:porin [Pusillimonas sp. TS35]|nr:porin [Pusillimonas sp. TS35]
MKYTNAATVAALALCGLTSASMAQASSVTLYGIVDAGVESYNNAPGGTETGMRSSGQRGTRWGLHGSEDLSNGLKTIFRLESGFNVGTGKGDSSGLFNRTSMVGLKGEWGELTLGRQYTSAFSITGAFTPFGWSGQYDPISRYVTSRSNNSVKYRGTFEKLDASAYYGFRSQEDQMRYDAGKTSAYGAAASYKFGPIRAMLGYDHLEATPTSTRTGDTDNYLAGLQAKFGSYKISGVYRYREIEQRQAADIVSHFFSLGAMYQFTPANSIELAYYREHFKNAPTGYLGLTDDTWQQFAARAMHRFSKRTNVYLMAVHARSGPINLGFTSDTGGAAYKLDSGKTHQSGVAIGLFHQF